jgi:NADPH-dependent ferric siderophore reductase
MNSEPQVTRVRHELRRRQLTVSRVEKLAPKLTRITLSGEELQGFTSLGFDDHVKLFFPSPESTPEPIMRDFTPRCFDAAERELTIDFVLHHEGPAATWAAQVSPGQTLAVGGPRGSAIIALEGIDSHLLIGDETALPAIGRRLEELSPGIRALVVIEAECGCAYPLSSRADLQIVWVARDARYAAPGEQLIATLRTLAFPQGRCFAWAAAETHAARAIRRYLTDERGFAKPWVKAAGYWQRGATAAHEVIQD